MALYIEHRISKTFNDLRRIITPDNRYDLVSLNADSESKTKPNGCKTKSDFNKRKIVPE